MRTRELAPDDIRAEFRVLAPSLDDFVYVAARFRVMVMTSRGERVSPRHEKTIGARFVSGVNDAFHPRHCRFEVVHGLAAHLTARFRLNLVFHMEHRNRGGFQKVHDMLSDIQHSGATCVHIKHDRNIHLFREEPPVLNHVI